MANMILALMAGVALGGGTGYFIAQESGETPSGHGHNSQNAAVESHGDHGRATVVHDHSKLLDLPTVDAPTVGLQVLADPASGWNLHVTTTNFKFSPRNASTEHVLGEGHAHIYIDGKKLGRLYGNWYHVPMLPEGVSEVRVGLFSNDHKRLSVSGQTVEDKVSVRNGP